MFMTYNSMKIRTDRWTDREDAKADSRLLHPQVKRQVERGVNGLKETYFIREKSKCNF